MPSEAAVQAAVRLEYARRGYHLFRNNVGVLRDQRGVPVRYGLANESRQQNEAIKSGDLIGWRPHVVTLADVGRTLAVLVSAECKASDWTPAPPTDRARYAHEQAQRRWAELVVAGGGEAGFIRSLDEGLVL